jgi:hypothetical protein
MNGPELQRFRTLLPFWVNGTLSTDDQNFMTEFLKQHPELEAEVTFNQALRDAVKAVGQDRAADAGLQRLRQAIRETRQTARTPWRQRWQVLCQSWGFTAAFAVMTMIVIIQSALLWQIRGSTVSVLTDYRSMPEVSGTADIKITVNPDIGFGHLVILLRQNGARIVNGPSESGELWISLDDRTRLENVMQQLRRAEGVLDVMAVEANGR